MAFSLDSLTPWITFALFLLPVVVPRIPSLINFLQRRFNPSSLPPSRRPPPPQPLPHSVLALSLLHSLYHIKNLILRPPNVFLLTGLPLLATPISHLHSVLLRLLAPHLPPASSSADGGLGTNPLPLSTLHLLSKLQSYDARVLYARFGQTTFLACTWCSSENDQLDWFAYWAVGAAVQYLGEILVWGVIVELAGRRNWRKYGVWALLAMGVVEAGWIWTGRIERGRGDGVQLFNQLHLYRHVALLLLPLVLPLLQPTPPQMPSQLDDLPALLPTVDTLLTHLKLIELSRVAFLRQPALREAVVETAKQMEKDSTYARDDADVINAGERVGLTGEEGVRGGLREGAKGFLGVARARMDASLEGMATQAEMAARGRS